MAAMIPTDDTPGALEAGTAWGTGLQVTDRTRRPLLVV
jgi:hypothetical protein